MQHPNLNNQTAVQALGNYASHISVLGGGTNGTKRLMSVINLSQNNAQIADFIMSMVAYDLSSETRGTARLAQMTANNTLNIQEAVNVDVTSSSFRGITLPISSVIAKLGSMLITMTGLEPFVTRIVQLLSQANPTNITQTVERVRLEIVSEVQLIRQQEGNRQNTSIAQKKINALAELDSRIDAMNITAIDVITAKAAASTLLSLLFDHDERSDMMATDEYQSLDGNMKHALQKWYNPTYRANNNTDMDINSDDDTDTDMDINSDEDSSDEENELFGNASSRSSTLNQPLSTLEDTDDESTVKDHSRSFKRLRRVSSLSNESQNIQNANKGSLDAAATTNDLSPINKSSCDDCMVDGIVQGLKQSRPDMQMGDVLLNVAGSLKVDPALVIAINEQYGGIVKSSLQLSSQVDIDEDIQAEIDKGPSHEQDDRPFAVSWVWPVEEEEAPAGAPVDTSTGSTVPAVNAAAETVAVRRSKRETLTNVCLKEPGIGGKLRAGYDTFVVKSLVGELTAKGWNYNQVEEALRWSNNDKEKAIARLNQKYPR